MKNKAVIDHIIGTANSRMAEEMSTLLGQKVNQSNLMVILTTKEEYFSEPQGKAALTHMQISGEGEGDSYVLISQDAAVFLGGTLIMLPDDEIESRIKSGLFDGEEADAFGEIANIIAGAYTSTFLDLYKKSLRFVKTSVAPMIPTKVDVDADEPFPPGDYCHARCTLDLEGRDLGFLDFLIPASILGLESETVAPTAAVPPSPTPPAQPQVETEAPSKTIPSTQAPQDETEKAEVAPSISQVSKNVPESTLEHVLSKALERTAVELSALLGHTLGFEDQHLELLTKEAFFETPRDLSVLSRLNLQVEEQTGQGFLLTRISDSVILGGTLIMLPPDELENRVSEGKLSGEERDAFEEVANIVAGALSACFLDLYPLPLRLSKAGIEDLAPTKVDPEGPEPFPPGSYYCLGSDIVFEGYEMGRIELVLPPELLGVASQQQATSTTKEQPTSSPAPASGTEASHAASGTGSAPPAVHSEEFEETASETASVQTHAVVLVLSNDTNNSDIFIQSLQQSELSCVSAGLQDNFKEILTQNNVKGIFLVLKEVDEQGFAAAIRLQSANQKSIPVVIAGPEWTRSKVIKAVHYGAQDILVTPSDTTEITEKIRLHLTKMG